MRKYFDQLNSQLVEDLFGFNHSKQKKKFLRLGVIVTVLFLMLAGVFLLFSLSSDVSRKSNYTSIQQTAAFPLINKFFSKKLPETFTLLFLGVPGESHKAPYLTDSIILFHYQSPKLTLFSLPRDLLVKIPGQEYSTKLNALYVLDRQNQKKPSLITQKIQEISGLPIDFYIVVDLELVKNSIDILGGINISVKQDIYDPKFPGPNNSYQTFELKAGWRYLDGATALNYVRSRFSPGGDFDRIDRQQQLLLAIKKKVFSLNPLTSLPELIKIYQNLKEHLKTNFNIGQGLSLADLLDNLAEENIKRFTIDRESGLLKDSQALLGNDRAYVLIPTAGQENYQKIQAFIYEANRRSR